MIFQTFRAIGLKKSDIVKLTLYEAIANIFSSSILGCVIGVISGAAMTALFLAIVELPFSLIVTFKMVLFMGVDFISVARLDVWHDCLHYYNGNFYRSEIDKWEIYHLHS